MLANNDPHLRSEKVLRDSFETNFFAHLQLIQATMPHFHDQKSGYLVFNSSMEANWNDGPGISAYGSAKAALDRLVAYFAVETAGLGYIHTLTINPGMTDTNITNPAQYDLDRPVLPETAKSGAETRYAELYGMFKAYAAQIHGNSPGDARKIAEVVVDVVRGEGVAEGKERPTFLPFGKDAVGKAKAYAENVLKVTKEWEGVVANVDRDGVGG
jgi:NAD(P)-dependent dehydrogenase (short-subunit alcohol dehydrogenase family)